MDERLTLLMLALVLNALLCGPRLIYRRLQLDIPRARLSAWIRTLERKLNRSHRSVEARRQRGGVVTALVISVSLITGILATLLFSQGYFGGLMELLMVTMLLGLRQSADFASEVSRHLSEGRIHQARTDMQTAGWRNAAVLDVHGLNRAVVETAVLQITNRMIMPGFYYLLFGLPGLFVAWGVTLLAENIGQPDDPFGYTPLRAHSLLAYPAAFISGLLITVSAWLLPFSHPEPAGRAWVYTLSEPHPARHILAITGAALNLALGGPTSAYAAGDWVGGTSARATVQDAQRMVFMIWTLGLLWLIVLGFGQLF